MRADTRVLRGVALSPGYARRLSRAGVAPSVAMTIRARELRAQGVDVMQLTIGEPDFASPPHAIAAAHEAALAGDTKYPPQDGAAALKAAIARRYARDHGLDVGPERIVVGNGGKQVIFGALLATVDEGDEVLIPTPYWSAYALMTEVVGGRATFVPCEAAAGFKLDPAALDAAITPRTRWVVLNSPNNPTGAALSRAELAAIGAVLERHPHVWVMTDDMYGRLRFDGAPPLTLAEVVPGLEGRLLTVDGASKTYAMTGWRIGWGIGPPALIRAMANMQGQATAGVSTVGQAATAAALDGPQHSVAEQVVAYRRRRDLVVSALRELPGVECHVPEGAFYVFPSIVGLLGHRSRGGAALDTCAAFATALLEEAHVATVPGRAFGGPGHLRLSTATDDATLLRACRAIAGFVRDLT